MSCSLNQEKPISKSKEVNCKLGMKNSNASMIQIEANGIGILKCQQGK